MAMQAAAIEQRINRHRRPVVRASVIAARAKGGDKVLRTIINGVGISGAQGPGRYGTVIPAAPDGFVIDGRSRSTALGRDPRNTIVVGKGDFDGVRTKQS